MSPVEPGMGGSVLLTGLTGSFGRHVAAELMGCCCEVVAVVRASSDRTAADRCHSVLRWKGPARLTAIAGDITQPRLGLPPRRWDELRNSLHAIVHCAALTRFAAPASEARKANVIATRRVRSLALASRHLRVFCFVSTAYVAGRREGRILETELEHDAGFLNAYDRSKFGAEVLVHETAGRIPTIIVRPSILLGGPGNAAGVSMALRMIECGRLSVLPGTEASRVDMVEPAAAAAATRRLVLDPHPGAVYHLTAGEAAPSAGEILAELLDTHRDSVRFVSHERFGQEMAASARREPRAAALYEELAAFVPYLAYPKVFDTACAEAHLGDALPVARPRWWSQRQRAYA